MRSNLDTKSGMFEAHGMLKRYLPFPRVVASFLGLLIGCRQSNYGETEFSKERVEALVKKEFPLGSSWERVETFLDKYSFEHSDHAPTSSADTVYAILRNKDLGSSIVKKSIQVILRFENNRLSGYEVTEVFTGP